MILILAKLRAMLRVLALLLTTVLLVGCGDDDDTTAAAGGPSVLATTTQVADLARHVAGDRARVTGLLRPNADPHDYEPRPSDAKAVASASLVLRSGGDLDEWLGDVIDNAGGEAEVVTLIDAVRTRRGDGEVDPHWWQNPLNAQRAVIRIRDALTKADPDGEAAYNRNAAGYVAEIAATDRAIRSCFAAVPAEQRKLVTNHDALGYFADRYSLEVIGAVIPALSTKAQASAGEVQDLAAEIRRERVKVVFPESSLNAKLERVIAKESGATVGRALYADTLGPAGSPGATYLGSLRANADAMVTGFTGGRRSCTG